MKETVTKCCVEKARNYFKTFEAAISGTKVFAAIFTLNANLGNFQVPQSDKPSPLNVFGEF